MLDSSDSQSNGSSHFSPTRNAAPVAEYAVDEPNMVEPMYDLGEIGVDEVGPPDPTAQASIDLPSIGMPVTGASGDADGESPVTPNGAESPGARDSPEPEPMYQRAYRGARSARSERSVPAEASAPPETRARAEEISSGSKIVPRIDDATPEFLGTYLELESWFATFDEDVSQWLAGDNSSSPVKQTLRACLRPGSSNASASQQVQTVTEATLAVIDEGSVLDQLVSSLPTTDFAAMTLLYVVLVVHFEHRPPLLAKGVPIISALISQVADMRWLVELDPPSDESTKLQSRLFMLCRMALLSTLGDGSAYHQTVVEVWRQYGLDPPQGNGDENMYASPLSYASFLHNVIKRFPTFMPSEDSDDRRAHHRHLDTRNKQPTGHSDPRELVNGSAEVVPYVPHSIIEACQLYKSRVRHTPQVLQLWEEQERAQHIDVPEPIVASTPATSAVTELYKSTMHVQKSFAQVLVDYIMQLGAGSPTVGTYAALSTVRLLRRWFDITHVLMGEYLEALLFDCHFHFMAQCFFESHSNVISVLSEFYELKSVWAALAGPTAVDDLALRQPDRGTQLSIENYNKHNLKTYTYMLEIVRHIILNKTQRTLVVAELPVDPLKSLFGVYEQELWSQLLQLFKLQVPFNGKRWRYLNMEIISAIYMYCPSKLDDDWLSGADVSQEVQDAPTQEHMLRAVIQAYNERLTKT